MYVHLHNVTQLSISTFWHDGFFLHFFFQHTRVGHGHIIGSPINQFTRWSKADCCHFSRSLVDDRRRRRRQYVFKSIIGRLTLHHFFLLHPSASFVHQFREIVIMYTNLSIYERYGTVACTLRIHLIDLIPYVSLSSLYKLSFVHSVGKFWLELCIGQW